jgi:hypothetical protein
MRGCYILSCSIFPIICFSLGMVEYHKIRTYVQTNCLVKKSFLKKCGTKYVIYDSRPKQCFLPIWLVEYIDYPIKETITINGSKVWMHRYDRSGKLYRFKIYNTVFMLECKEYSLYIKPLLLLLNRLARLIRAIILVLIL